MAASDEPVVPAVRSIMGEGVTDTGLIDISGLTLGDVLTADESSLDRALARILASDRDDAYNSFQASI